MLLLWRGDLSDVAMWASLNAQCEHVTTWAAHHRWKFRVPFSLCRGKAVKQSNVCVDITVSVPPQGLCSVILHLGEVSTQRSTLQQVF